MRVLEVQWSGALSLMREVAYCSMTFQFVSEILFIILATTHRSNMVMPNDRGEPAVSYK